MKQYIKPSIQFEQFATNEYVAACGTEITRIPEQTIKCIATCEETVFAASACEVIATLVTVSSSNDWTTHYYKDTSSAATDIYDGILGNGINKNGTLESIQSYESPTTSTNSGGGPGGGNNGSTTTYATPVSVGVEYVVWTEEDHYHANVYSVIKETLQKS